VRPRSPTANSFSQGNNGGYSRISTERRIRCDASFYPKTGNRSNAVWAGKKPKQHGPVNRISVPPQQPYAFTLAFRVTQSRNEMFAARERDTMARRRVASRRAFEGGSGTMPIVVTCSCGKRLRARDEFAGRKAKCPGCGTIVTLVAATAPEDDTVYLLENDDDLPPPTLNVATRPAATVGADTATFIRPRGADPEFAVRNRATSAPPEQRSGSARDYLYLLLLLAFIPLGFQLLQKSDEDLRERLSRTLEHAPREVVSRVSQIVQSEKASLDDVLGALPDNRLIDAHLPRNTWVHWVYAMLAAGLFFSLLLACFPQKEVKPLKLLLVGLFTGTIGIIFLIVVQWLAQATEGRWVTGRGWITLLFYIVKFIGFSYHAALDPENGFLLSFFGFTCGVGLCEELCKALPLFPHHREGDQFNWRAYCLIGLASGVGFGISEGIMYSGDHYNGVSPGSIYVVRFISCVALHAVWTAAIAVALSKTEPWSGETDSGAYASCFFKVATVPMLLHGLYDTLLKREMSSYALLAALASFAWLAFQVETARARDRD
jgi:RsiW-degrading membrane proteinase PrsW (M82 family)